MSCLNKSYDKFANGGGAGRISSRNKWGMFAAGLLIVFLLIVIIVVWVLVGQGRFTPKRIYNLTIDERIGPQMIKINKDEVVEARRDDFISAAFVKPMKISPGPLHTHDIIYDQSRNNHGHVQVRHHSGHFRRKSAELWDPHPSYEIDAFDKKFILDLEHNNKLVSPNLHVFKENYTEKENSAQRQKHDSNLTACYYTGKVRGDPASIVTVSLCHGMTGHIQTSDGSYYIKPAETFDEDTGTNSILHEIGIVSEESNSVDFDVDQCETKPNNADGDSGLHHRQRRSIHPNRLDIIDDVYSTWVGGEVRHAKKKNLQKVVSPYYIEALIVADKKMARYHKTDEELIHYILTLMAHAALLYKDATIGNPITITVVDIMILRDREFTSQASQEMLQKFCEFQHSHSIKAHDVALLLTRDVICKTANSTFCNTLGVAEVGSMCQSSSCAIIKDKGLSTGYTIAHELGHVLSMPHDDDERCINHQGGVKANNAMSKALQNGTKPWHWSSCSKHFLTEFLESPKSHCLLNIPEKDYITSEFDSMHHLPGETFEVDRQCELEFGNGSRMCIDMVIHTQVYCTFLWCTTWSEKGDGNCKTQFTPWAEGTSCGQNRWCRHGECIALNRNILSPIAGGWSNWSEWGGCTRTCGGGIRMSKRECNNPRPANGGPYCTGGSIRYSSCNTNDCESNVPDFRELQCAMYNGNTMTVAGLSSDVKWVPKYGFTNQDNVCQLYCRPNQETSYYLLQEKVTDGTKCGLFTHDICVNGMCQESGCDNQLNSNMVMDDCGVCGGDNSKCVIVTGVLNKSRQGYNKVIRIPTGSTNIRVTQRGYNNSNKDDNYLAIKNVDNDDYILNGERRVSTWAKEISYGGLMFRYSGSNQILEEIRSTTPNYVKLKKDLLIEVLSVGKVLPPDIEYSYTISANNTPRFAWVYSEKYNPCDSICSGYKTKLSECKDLAQNKIVNATMCVGIERQEPIMCNKHCKLMWSVADRGHCSAHCGIGLRSVTYNCIKHWNSHKEEKVEEKHCQALPRQNPEEECIGSCESTRWDYTDWTQCTKTCGGGIQTRNAYCVDENHRQIDDEHCNADEKHVRQRCNAGKCPMWSYEDWTPCSVTCGLGYRSKPYYCHIDNVVCDKSYCDQSQLQSVREECSLPPCQMAEWSTGHWSECQDRCGPQERDVYCIQGYKKVDEIYCRDLLRPNASRECPIACVLNFEDNNIINIHPYKWKTGAWTNCSGPCENRVKKRLVACVNEENGESMQHCDSNTRPVDTARCPEQCYKWVPGQWSRCMNRQRRRHVFCQNSHSIQVDPTKCDHTTKPIVIRNCNKPWIKSRNTNHYDLGTFQWEIGRWGKCSETCGNGKRTRVIKCVDIQTNITYVDGYCKHLKTPKMSHGCKRNNCKYTWVEGDWSPCSATCGWGKKYREVTCHKVLPGGEIDTQISSFISPQQYCDVYKKPNNTTDCIESNCNDDYRWHKGVWSNCSSPCGKKGRQMRHVRCLDPYGHEVHNSFCPKNFKPRKKQKCNMRKCLYNSCKDIKHKMKTNENKDYMLDIHGRLATIYCYKMDSNDPEEFISLKPGRENYAEFYNKQLINVDTCPNGGMRRDNCHCVTVPNGGKTFFWKVRLNITSLQIITDDYTFSQQTHGDKVPYGTSGDCYSRSKKCPQGNFFIDLRGTSFRLSKHVRWTTTGDMASKDVRISSDVRIADGKCGGYCGKCHPDKSIGLKVEIT